MVKGLSKMNKSPRCKYCNRILPDAKGLSFYAPICENEYCDTNDKKWRADKEKEFKKDYSK